MINWVCTIDDSGLVNAEASCPQEAADMALVSDRAIYMGLGNLYNQPMYFEGELTGRGVQVMSEKKLSQNEIGLIGRVSRRYGSTYPVTE